MARDKVSAMEKEKKYTVRICEDYVVRDPDKVKEILDRVSKIVSKSYIRK
jgi:hypothetical protein